MTDPLSRRRATTERCYRDPDNGVHFTRDRHHPDCEPTDCRGCVKCPGDHCAAKRNCTWHVEHGTLTCGRCLAEVRRDLRWIAELSALLLTAAISDGLESEAANLAGPATDPEAWSWRKAAARAGRHWHVSLIEDDDEHHPLRVLSTWDRMIREDFGHDTDVPPTITSAADYLDHQLHRIAQDDGQDFPLLRRELRKCRQHLEAVLHNDTRPDRGAPCPTCVRETGKGAPLRREYAHWCDSEDCQRFHLTDDGSDVWRCPKDRAHWWTQQGYADEVREMWEDAATRVP